MSIPLNIETLLSGQVVESERIEFKRGWNPIDIIRTVAAFANDFDNLGSGYIVVGIEEENGMPKRPVYGFAPTDFDRVQKEMLGYCNLIRPSYFPRLSLEAIDGKYVLVIWVVAGPNRPYEAPRDVLARTKDYAFFIRRFSSSVMANTTERQELISLTANIPFDDRLNHQATVQDISARLLEQHLQAIGSRLVDQSISHLDLCHQMNLVEGPDESVLPKNVALMLFNQHPEKFFPATTINLTEFPDGLAGDSFIEKTFFGAIQNQLMDALEYLKKQVIKSKTIKLKDQAASNTFFNYPFQAIEEALANAVYHKNYEIREPIEVRVLPEAIEIISYGGPDPSIRKDDLNRGVVRARRYRNRRIGEFLKELKLTEGKGTGIPTIKRALEMNGSQPASYDTDGDERRFFLVEIPIHQAFIEHVEKHQEEHVVKDKHVDEQLEVKKHQDKHVVKDKHVDEQLEVKKHQDKHVVEQLEEKKHQDNHVDKQLEEKKHQDKQEDEQLEEQLEEKKHQDKHLVEQLEEKKHQDMQEDEQLEEKLEEKKHQDKHVVKQLEEKKHQDKHEDEQLEEKTHQDNHVDKQLEEEKGHEKEKELEGRLQQSENNHHDDINELFNFSIPKSTIEKIKKVLEFCEEPQSSEDIMLHLGLVKNSRTYKRNIEPAIEAGLLKMTLPDKPTSRNQKYQTTSKGKRYI